MKRTNNKNVAAAWHAGTDAQSNNGNYSTHDGKLYSYRMLIGVTAPDGTKYLLNVRGKNRYSSTTSQHVSKAILGATLVEPIVSGGWRHFPKNVHPGYMLTDYGIFYTLEQYRVIHPNYQLSVS